MMAEKKLAGELRGLAGDFQEIRNCYAWRAIDHQAPKAERDISEAKAQAYGLMTVALDRLFTKRGK
jgi:hypothetical protein